VGPHFKNTVLDVCGNRGAKREMGGHRFQMGGRASLLPPLATTCIGGGGNATACPCFDLSKIRAKFLKTLPQFMKNPKLLPSAVLLET